MTFSIEHSPCTQRKPFTSKDSSFLTSTFPILFHVINLSLSLSLSLSLLNTLTKNQPLSSENDIFNTLLEPSKTSSNASFFRNIIFISNKCHSFSEARPNSAASRSRYRSKVRFMPLFQPMCPAASTTATISAATTATTNSNSKGCIHTVLPSFGTTTTKIHLRHKCAWWKFVQH